jgi:glutamate dehydrogenase
MLANSIINRGGPGFVSRLSEETGATVAEIAAAFTLAREAFRLRALNDSVDALDNKVPGQIQSELYLDLQRLLKWSTVWFLRHESPANGLEALVALYAGGIEEISGKLDSLVPAAGHDDVEARREELIEAGVPEKIAKEFAWHRHLYRAPDIVRIAAQTEATLDVVGRALYASAADLGIDRLILEGSKLAAKDFIERQAINRLLTQVFSSHRALVAQAVTEAQGNVAAWPAWVERHGDRYRKTQTALASLLGDKAFTLARLTVAQGLIHDLVAG